LRDLHVRELLLIGEVDFAKLKTKQEKEKFIQSLLLRADEPHDKSEDEQQT
jgi:hypothetical protein